MTTFGSSSAAQAAPNGDTGSSDSETPSTEPGGEPADGSSDDGDTPGSEASSIEADDIEDLPGTGREEDEELEIGEVFELLKNERRRRVIHFLKDQEDGTTTLDVLAEHIAALENDIDVAQLSSSQRKRVYIGLYQCHLPKMDDFGVVEFRKNRGIIHLHDTSALDPYLPEPDRKTDADADADATEAAESAVDAPETADGEGETDDQTTRVQLPVAAGVAAITLVGAAGLGPLAAVPAVGWTLFSVVALLWAAAT